MSAVEDALDNLPEDWGAYDACTDEELEEVCLERPDIVIEALQRCIDELKLVNLWAYAKPGTQVKLLEDFHYRNFLSLDVKIPAGTIGKITEIWHMDEFDVVFEGFPDAHTLSRDEIEMLKEAIK